MTKKLYDLAVKVGEYTNTYGEIKGRWVTAGAVMQGNDGGKFIMLDRTFNPAGVPNPENRSSLILSMFEPRDSGHATQNAPAGPHSVHAAASAPQSGNANNIVTAQPVNDLPF